MKNSNILNCYVNGKKSAFCFEPAAGALFLMSHSSGWNNATLPNMYGWKFALNLCAWSTFDPSQFTLDFVRFLLSKNAGIEVNTFCAEGTPEYDEIRANIKHVNRGPRKTTKVTAAPAAEPVVPVPSQEPDPAPVVVSEPVKSSEIFHEKYNTILTVLETGEACYLFGPAGSGKNHIAEQIAEALGLEFYYQNSITDEYKINGFIDAAGTYHETEFYRAFKNGGLFMMDELDASCPDTLVTLNAALANKYFTFPTGRVKMNPDFKCIAAGNTAGRGATEEYNGRMVLDGASLDRFTPVKFDYCAAIEDRLAGGRADVLEFCRDMRQAAAAAGIKLILGYRGITRLTKFAARFSAAEAVELAITGTLDRDEINILKAHLQHPQNVFALAM